MNNLMKQFQISFYVVFFFIVALFSQDLRSQNERPTPKFVYKAEESLFSGNYYASIEKCEKALEFHHLDPEKKDFNISKSGHTRSWKSVKNEIEKCILVCGNCHSEIHGGLINLDKITIIKEKNILVFSFQANIYSSIICKLFNIKIR